MQQTYNPPSSLSGRQEFYGKIIFEELTFLVDESFERALDAELNWLKEDLERYIRLFRSLALANPDWTIGQVRNETNKLTGMRAVIEDRIPNVLR